MAQETIPTRHRRFGENLLAWWRNNRRDFPWRNTADPYRILISEILLHRTRADQVVPVYNEFIREFPTLKHLAKAKQARAKELLHPLGLFWRNNLLKPLAMEIVNSYNGVVPWTIEQLESLPGVSEYIAAAVSCFAFGDREPLLDTNTVRILGRVFGLTTGDGSRRSRRLAELYRSLMGAENARDFGYAMIDLGALICSPRDPDCEICPVNDMCNYGASRIGRAK